MGEVEFLVQEAWRSFFDAFSVGFAFRPLDGMDPRRTNGPNSVLQSISDGDLVTRQSPWKEI